MWVFRSKFSTARKFFFDENAQLTARFTLRPKTLSAVRTDLTVGKELCALQSPEVIDVAKVSVRRRVLRRVEYVEKLSA